jgi:hypothetical protein
VNSGGTSVNGIVFVSLQLALVNEHRRVRDYQNHRSGSVTITAWENRRIDSPAVSGISMTMNSGNAGSTAHDAWTCSTPHQPMQTRPDLRCCPPCSARPAKIRWSFLGSTAATERTSGGHNTVVGAGSVVLGDLPDHAVAACSPARVIRRTSPEAPA